MLRGLILIVACFVNRLLTATPITLTVYKEFTQISKGYQFHTFNMVFMGGNFYSLYGFGFNKASLSDIAYTTLNLTSLTSQVPVSATFTVIGIPEANKLIYINPTGVAYVIDPNNAANPVVATQTLLYMGYNLNVFVYQIERKLGTNFFYMTNLYGKTIQKIDYTNLASTVRILSGPHSDLGYEMLSPSPTKNMIALTVNGLYIDVYDTTTDTFTKTLNIGEAWQGKVFRGVKHYSRAPNTEYFFVTTSTEKGYLVNSIDSTMDKEFSITGITDPAMIKYIQQSNYMAVMGMTYLYFVNMEGSDSDTLIHTMAQEVLYAVMDIVDDSGNKYLASTFVNGTGKTYLFNLGTNICHFTCQTCSKSLDLNACLTCRSGYAISGTSCMPIASPGQVVSSSGISVVSCSAGQYKNFDMACKNCPANCNTCKDYTGYCTACASTNRISPFGNCIASCTSQQYPFTVVANNYCGMCHPSCKTCSGSTSTTCSTCDTTKGFTQTGNTCVDRCVGTASAATSYLINNDTCAQCTGVGNCKQCTFPGLSFSCTNCNGGFLWYNGVCVSSCPDGLITNTPAMKCESCEEQGPNMIFYNGSCITNTQCPTGMTLQGLTCVNASAPQPAPLNPFSQPNVQTPITTNTTQPLDQTTKTNIKDEESGSSSGYFLYIILAILALGLIAGVVICYMRSKKRKLEQQMMGRNGQVAPMQHTNTHYVNHNQHYNPQQGGQQQEGDWDLRDEQAHPNYGRQNLNSPPPMNVVDFSKSNFILAAKPTPFTPIAPYAPESANDWKLPQQSGSRPNNTSNLMESGISEMNGFSSRNPQQPGTMEAGFARQAGAPKKFVPRRTEL
jgi:hypothetical protein